MAPGGGTSAAPTAGPRPTYTPVLADHFPRTEYARLRFYAHPVASPSPRVLWAARDASKAWARAVAAQCWDAMDELMVRLAVFDKAYELNQAQWGHRPCPTAAEWQRETDGYIAVAYLCAGRALHAVGQDKRMPSLGLVSPFCRAAMDLCAAPLVDAEPLVPAPMEEDSLGEVLGEYDPLLRHKAELDVSEAAYAETFTLDPATGYWVLDHDAAGHGRNSCPTPVKQVGHDHPETRDHIDDDPRVTTPASDTAPTVVELHTVTA